MKTGKAQLILLIGIVIFSLVSASLWMIMSQERTKRVALETQYKELETRAEKLRTQIKELEAVKSELQGKVSQAEEEAQRLTAEMEQSQELNKSLLEQLEEQKKNIEDLSTQLTTEKKEKTEISQKLNESTVVFNTMKDELDRLKIEKADLEVKIKNLFSQKGTLLDKIVVNPGSKASPTYGKVVVVNREFGFIVTNLGTSSKIKKGDIVSIYTNEPEQKVLGEARIKRIYRTLSVAELLPTTDKEQVKEGDLVLKSGEPK